MAGPDRTAREDATIEMVARQVAVVTDLADRAADARGWLAVGRQAKSYLRHLEPWLAQPAGPAAAAALATHRTTLRVWGEKVGAELGAFDAAAVAEARSQLGIRLAVIGKGGAGKTVIVSTLARTLARRGRQVFAADLDTNPGLAISLGLGMGDFDLPAPLVEEDAGSNYGWRLAGGILPRQAVEKFATVGPDGVRFLGLGKIMSAGKGAPKQSVVALTQILLGFGEADWDVVADLEAGPTTPFERYHAFAEDVIVVVGPSWQSAMTARRLLPMVGERTTRIVANRVRDEPDHQGLEPLVRIPNDADVSEAERRGRSPLDYCPDSPAIAAIGRLADLLTTTQEVRT
jgi:CO dehydrogenase maturation factor